MKRLIYILPVLIILFTSCEKVINVKLKNAAPQYVVEANLFEGNQPFRVHVAKTTDYFGTEPQEQINDAVVTLYDGANQPHNVPFSADGWYELPSFTAVSGNTYKLKVEAAGNVFTASATMQPVINIDSITFKHVEGGFQEPGYRVTAHFEDPAGTRNFYRLLLTENGALQNKEDDLYLLDDKYNDGKHVLADFFDLKDPNTTIEIELRTMDEGVYDFYTTLNDILNNQNGPAPGNPNTNIQGGALGYFGAFTSSKMSIVLPPQ